MTVEVEKDTALLEKALRRVEELTAALEAVADPHTHGAARELLELMLDLHGLALARMTAAIANAKDGPALLETLIADPHVCGILLLHGLHPHDAKARLNQAIARMHPQWAERGFQVDLLSVGAASARIRLYKNGSSEPVDELRDEVQEMLTEAAPDLDEILVEVEIAGAAVTASAVDMTGAAVPALHAK